jgi:uncharacterized membrane protein
MLVSLLGLAIGAVISFALSSVSTDAAFFAIVGATVFLVIVASSLRAAIDDTDQKQDVRDIAAVVPVPSSIETRAATVAAKLSRSESESAPK